MEFAWKRSSAVIGAAAALALVLSACGGPAPQTEESKAPAPGASADAVPSSPTIDKIKSSGELKVGVLSQLPWVGENAGNSADPWYGPTWMQAQKVAEALGVKLVSVPVSHATKVTAVQTGQVDLTIAPLNLTDARKKVIDFATNSMDGQCFVTLKTNTKVTSVEDLKKPDLTVGIPLGGSQEQLIPTQYPDMKIKPQQLPPGVNWATASTLNGTTDLTIFPSAQVYLLLKAYPDKFNVTPAAEQCLAEPLLPIITGWGVQKGDSVFVEFVQGILDDTKADFDKQFTEIAKSLGK
jgi:ABC-type amino acid transport/signal transduction systems, periplasmic component/domain